MKLLVHCFKELATWSPFPIPKGIRPSSRHDSRHKKTHVGLWYLLSGSVPQIKLGVACIYIVRANLPLQLDLVMGSANGVPVLLFAGTTDRSLTRCYWQGVLVDMGCLLHVRHAFYTHANTLTAILPRGELEPLSTQDRGTAHVSGPTDSITGSSKCLSMDRRGQVAIQAVELQNH
jgi:hypothetical protein